MNIIKVCEQSMCIHQNFFLIYISDFNHMLLLMVVYLMLSFKSYRKTSSIIRTKSQNLNVSCILLQLSSLNPLKLGVKLRMKM